MNVVSGGNPGAVDPACRGVRSVAGAGVPAQAFRCCVHQPIGAGECGADLFCPLTCRGRSSLAGWQRVRTADRRPRILSAHAPAIVRAEFRVDLELYLVEAGRCADAVVEALEQAASRGVRVRCLFDDYGSLAFPQRCANAWRRRAYRCATTTACVGGVGFATCTGTTASCCWSMNAGQWWAGRALPMNSGPQASTPANGMK